MNIVQYFVDAILTALAEVSASKTKVEGTLASLPLSASVQMKNFAQLKTNVLNQVKKG